MALLSYKFFRNFLAVVAFYLSYILLRPFFKIIFSVKVTFPENFREKIQFPVIFVTNHKTHFDPWIFAAMMPFVYLRGIVPIRYMATTRFKHFFMKFLYRIGVIKTIYFIYNVLTITDKETIEEKLTPYIKALQSNQTVMLFPEGGLFRHDAVGEFKRGAVYLHAMSGMPILPASIRFSGNGLRKKCHVHFGNPLMIPINLKSGGDAVQADALKHLREIIVGLYEYAE